MSYFVSWVFSFCFFINWNILGWLLINIKTYYMKGTSTNIGRSTSSQQSNIWYRRLLTCRDHDIVSFHIISELYLIESLHFDKFMKYTKKILRHQLLWYYLCNEYFAFKLDYNWWYDYRDDKASLGGIVQSLTYFNWGSENKNHIEQLFIVVVQKIEVIYSALWNSFRTHERVLCTFYSY